MDGQADITNDQMDITVDLTERELGADDIHLLVNALLEGIRRGELTATEKEVEFLVSIDGMFASVA